MSRPQLTPEQRDKVIKELMDILKDAGIIDQCKEIAWDSVLQVPKIDPILLNQLKGRHLDKYVTLLNRIKSGTIR